jgi:Domain of unknown function (DUF4402)
MNLGVTNQVGRIRAALRTVLALMVLTLFAGQAQAQEVASASASAQATVVAPLTLIKVTDINFGRVAARPTAGTVTINVNSGACTTTGGIIHQGACQYAEFAGMGRRRMTTRIQVPASITLTGPAGATMLVDQVALGTATDWAMAIAVMKSSRTPGYSPSGWPAGSMSEPISGPGSIPAIST